MKTSMKQALLLLATVAVLKTNLFGQETKAITLHVVDETGSPLENARTVISYVMGRDADEHIGLTDRNGVFSAQGTALVGIYLAASKDGYYPARFDNSRSDVLPSGSNIEKLFVLPRVLKPTALYALDLRPGRGHSMHFPVQNEWLGYDFKIGDWVPPYGKGRIADILFRFRNQFIGWKSSDKDMENNRRINSGASEEEIRFTYGKFDAELEISFPGEKEGIHEEKDRFLPYGQLKLPHTAPADGYVSTWRYTANTYSPTTARDNVGFFLRTRIQLDESGNITSTNYTKILGDFYLDARGDLRFSSYFNPVPNDRNLEFDPKRNLFPANFPGANVSDP
jgi:hypothetical protein